MCPASFSPSPTSPSPASSPAPFAPAFFDDPDPPDPGDLRGIARLARDSDHAEDRGGVEFREIEIRRLLNRVDGTRARFEWSINPYRGCEFGCVYCYARYTHEFLEKDPSAFERLIYVKRDVASTLRRDLVGGRAHAGEILAIGSATDPYQPAERRFGRTRAVLETLLDFRGFRVEITTKSDLVLRDAELLARLGARHSVTVNVSVTTMDADLARELEPRAPTPRRRMDGVAALNAAGVRAGVFLMPVLPGINDSDASLGAVLREARAAGAAFVSHQPLFLPKASRAVYEDYLKRSRPELLGMARRLYAAGLDVPDAWRRRLRERLHEMKRREGFAVDAAPEPGAKAGSESGSPPAGYDAPAPARRAPARDFACSQTDLFGLFDPTGDPVASPFTARAVRGSIPVRA